MVMIKVNDASDAVLDWLVAECEGYDLTMAFSCDDRRGVFFMDRDDCLRYSTDWSQAGPIIEREKISLEDKGQGFGNARIYHMHHATGDTPLIAAMRCYVKSKMGDTVEVPDEIS